jgi:hypothetical protein
MKNLIATIAIALVGFSAQASMVENYYADLTTFQFQKGTQLEQLTTGFDVNANVSITPISDISVSIFRSYHCAHGMMCPAIAYAPITYSVTKPTRSVGTCNETIFTGKVDGRLVDGGMTKITVIDNSTNTCKTFVMLQPTVVILEVQGPREAKSQRHVLNGNALHELM